MAKKGRKSEYVISIDPSINACGYAIHEVSTGKLVDYGLISPKHAMRAKDKLNDYLSKSRYVMDQVKELLDAYDNIELVTEVPDHWGAQGYEARESGSIYKLTFVCGMICALSKDVMTYLPREWKGQRSKDVMRRRLGKFFKDEKIKLDVDEINHNVLDAIQIGRHHIGKRI